MDQQGYCWDSEDYLKHSSAQYKWAQELIKKLHLQGTESIREIGCEDGKVTARINGDETDNNTSDACVMHVRR